MLRGRYLVLSVLAAFGAWGVVAAEDVVVLEADGIQVTEGEVAARIEEIRRVRGLKGAPPIEMIRQVVAAMQKSKAMERDALARNLDKKPEILTALEDARRQVMAGALLQAAKETIEMPDLEQAARDYYDTHLNEFKSPARVKASHILLRLECDCMTCDCLAERAEKAEQARQLLERLENGESFTQLAVDLSEDTATAPLGGSLGAWISKEEVDPKFAAAAFELKPGEISGIVETRFGFHVIRLDERAEEEQIPFDKMKAGIIESLSKDYVTRQVAKFSEIYDEKAQAGQWDTSALERLATDADANTDEAASENPKE